MNATIVLGIRVISDSATRQNVISLNAIEHNSTVLLCVPLLYMTIARVRNLNTAKYNIHTMQVFITLWYRGMQMETVRIWNHVVHIVTVWSVLFFFYFQHSRS